MAKSILRLYDRIVLAHPVLILIVLAGLLGYLTWRIKDFRLDASADSLILEHDKDLQFFRTIANRYGSREFLIITLTPATGDPFADPNLATLTELRDALRGVTQVDTVLTILDVPLLKNPPVPIAELKGNIKTLTSPDVDMDLARQEFRDSPLFSNLLVSEDLGTTALLVYLKADEAFQALLKRRTELRDKADVDALTEAERKEAIDVEKAYDAQRMNANRRQHEAIAAIRRVMDDYRDRGRLFLGGVPMVADDMMVFIRNDLKIFGLGLALFLIVTLGIIFRRFRWVLLPFGCCAFSVLAMMGLLGVCGWDVTVISSNFISLQLIMTMALAIHLVVRYTEELNDAPDADNRTLVKRTVATIFKPCLYTTLTTIAGFSSLVFCNILPVINFGWMMTIGLVVSLIVSFLLFPTILILLPTPKPHRGRAVGDALTRLLAHFTDRHGRLIVALAVAGVIATLVGIARLQVENSFIDYFRKWTEIHQGMKFIDQNLGGTTPLEVIVDLGPQDGLATPVSETEGDTPATDSDFDDFDEFDEFDDAAADDKYWFTKSKVDTTEEVHAYMDSLDAIGKTLSLATLTSVARDLLGEAELDPVTLAVFFNSLPEDFREVALDPYVSIPNDEVRVSVRIKDSLPSLRRNELLQRINRELVAKVGLRPDQFRLGGMMVLYNNMLQSLFRSQIQTIGITVFALLLMFLVLFRSLKVSLIAIFPNLMASLAILGVMGLLDIPLDMMTITIVAISIGIAVDNTIHYLHRFKHELPELGNYRETMYRCHGTIGHAMYYTSITIVVGFSILAFSNFIPTVLFGLLTGLAMTIALLAALTLLPRLVLLFKPFGPDRPVAEQSEGSRRIPFPRSHSPSVGGSSGRSARSVLRISATNSAQFVSPTIRTK